jgi:hypothetical protein
MLLDLIALGVCVVLLAVVGVGLRWVERRRNRDRGDENDRHG